MLRKTSLTALLALFLLPALAQRSLLYKVTGKGLAQPSYLYGTIHLICPEDLQITPALQNAVKAARSVYFELDMDDSGVAEAAALAMEVPEGYDLKQHFKPGDFDRLSTFLKDSMQMDINELRNMRPMVVQMMLAIRLAIPCMLPTSYEEELLKMAVIQKKGVEGLETPAVQQAALNAVPDSVQAAGIMEMVDAPGKQKELFIKLVQAYKSGNIDAFYDIRNDNPEFPDMTEVLLDQRNRNWIPVIEKAMRQGPILVACGAAHLGGAQGLLALLKAQGYKVTPVL